MNKSLLCIALISLILVGCSKVEVQQQVFTVEAGDEIVYDQLISCDLEVEMEVISEDIDSKQIGEYTITYNIKYKNKTQEHSIQLSIVDTTAPDLNQLKKVFEYGADIDIKSYVSASDICDETPEIEVVSGNIDTNSPGNYEVEFIATDDSGNSAREIFEFTVEEKKYTLDEIVTFIQNEVSAINSVHNNILDCTVDEFGNGIMVTSTEMYKADYNRFLGFAPSLYVQKDQERKIALGILLYPADDDIFQNPKKFYMKSTNGQIELGNPIDNGWNYNGNLFISTVIFEIGNEVEDNTEDYDGIISVASGDDVRIRLTGNHEFNASISKDSASALAELTRVFVEVKDMYN